MADCVLHRPPLCFDMVAHHHQTLYIRSALSRALPVPAPLIHQLMSHKFQQAFKDTHFKPRKPMSQGSYADDRMAPGRPLKNYQRNVRSPALGSRVSYGSTNDCVQ
ncbi:hypothetical protein CDAR_47261 [Caerostris darwini]|uniref:Uncharacterized protein n=1 Tax=Caerostris darwini TaxID=1538125 RepID=A0AAV4S9J9_9ARAC|nr:hypothetical protein CDAR_47261 [Caerostris darwini]